MEYVYDFKIIGVEGFVCANEDAQINFFGITKDCDDSDLEDSKCLVIEL